MAGKRLRACPLFDSCMGTLQGLRMRRRAGNRLVAMNEQLPMKTPEVTKGAAGFSAPDKVSPRPIVAVLGMHRSGTSLCAHVLSCLGIDMADKLLVNSGNAKGHWERLELMALHDRMLALCNRGYFTPLHDLALPEAWWANPQVQTIKREILEFLERRIGAIPFGFKDPRTARLIPVWNQIFRELNLVPKFVLCLRNPAQVARSLRDRDHLDPQIGEYRWFVYLTDILQYIGKNEFCLIEYEDWFTKPGRNIKKLQRFLEIEWSGSKADMHRAVSEIVDGELRHDDPRFGQAREPIIHAFYKLVRASPGDSAARKRTRKLATQFAVYRKLQRPFERALENAEALADKVVPLEQEIARLQTSLGERDAEMARMGTAAREVQVELEARHVELAASRQGSDEQSVAAAGFQSALADAQRAAREALEAADRTAAELTGTQAELAARDAALAEAGQIAAEWAAAMDFAQSDLARMQAELAARDLALAEAEQNAAQVAAAAGQAEADLGRVRLEFVAREAAIAAAEGEAAEQAAAAERLQAELARLRADLATRDTALAAARGQAGEQETQIASLRDAFERATHERRIADAAAQANIQALQSELAVARQTAAASIAAFRTEFAAPAKRRDGVSRGRGLWRIWRSYRSAAVR